jgi:hypothetical protein
MEELNHIYVVDWYLPKINNFQQEQEYVENEDVADKDIVNKNK